MARSMNQGYAPRGKPRQRSSLCSHLSPWQATGYVPLFASPRSGMCKLRFHIPLASSRNQATCVREPRIEIRIEDCFLGKGLFATRDFRPGDTILQMQGPLVNTKQALAKGEKQSDDLQIRQDTYVDLEDPGRCANHSCDPNAGVRPNLSLVAIRPIATGEEIC